MQVGDLVKLNPPPGMAIKNSVGIAISFLPDKWWAWEVRWQDGTQGFYYKYSLQKVSECK